jgi:apolipoprotein N-acyltransferase
MIHACMSNKRNKSLPADQRFAKGYGNPRLFWLRIGAVLISAAVQPALSAPFSWWPLHWISWIPFLWAIHSQKGKGNMFLGYLGGSVSNLLIFYWVVNLLPNFTNIKMPMSILLVFLLCSYLSLSWIILAWLIPKISRWFPRAWIFISPALLVVIEWIIPQLFPYMQGASHYQVTPIIQLASLTGLYGVSYLLFLSNSVFYDLIHRIRSGNPVNWYPVLVLAVVVTLTLVYGVFRIQKYNRLLPGAKNLKVGLIQANFTPRDAAVNGFDKIHKKYMELSQQAVEQGAQWVVWSEGEFLIPLNTTAAKDILIKACHKLGCPILFGGYGEEYIGDLYVNTNSATHVHPLSGLGKRYDKQILVPFGEYMPFARSLDFIYSKINWTSRFFPGKDSVVQIIDNIPYAFLICYEAIYPSLARKAVRMGARILVNITYDAWFGRTTAPYQHLMLSTIRSVEMGVPMIRLATTGITTSVDVLGRAGYLSSLFKQEVLVHSIPLIYMPTLYSRTGDLFAWLCLGMIMVAILTVWLKRARTSA